jgi:hypothetical protein
MRKLILVVGLVSVVLLAGCIEQDENGVEELPYKDDVITIEDYYVSDITPYEGSPTIIDFLVKNNGEEPVGRVEVGFDAPGFDIQSLECEGFETNGNKCTFDKNTPSVELGEIEPFDTRSVVASFKFRNIGLMNPQTFTITYYVEYDYSGFRKMDIPIIDGVTFKKPQAEYGQSTPTYGPIRLNFEPPLRGERVEGGETITEHWGVRDHPFKVEMQFEHIGSSSIGSVTDPKINAEQIRLDLRDSLRLATVDGTELQCDFKGSDGYLISKEELEVPGELICSFQSIPFSNSNFDAPETTATIWAEFDYTYRYTRGQNFDVQPVGE